MRLFHMVISVILLSTSLAWADTDCNFECTLKKHLDAIQAKDFKQFEQTITPGHHINFILPNGKYFDDPQAFRSMLKDWFTQGGWTFDYSIISKRQSDTLGHALLLVDYNEADRGGKPYHIDHYLSLVFEKQDGRWYLVHDQNTKTTLVDEQKAP